MGSYGGSLDMGDLDGDGVDDLVVGATGSSYFAPELIDADEPGAVYLHLGSPQGLDPVSRTKVRPCGETEPVPDSFGALVRVVGDLDRDGTDDVVISGVTGPAILYGRATWPAEACAVPWHPTPPTVACDDPVPGSPDTGTPVDTVPPDPVTDEAAPTPAAAPAEAGLSSQPDLAPSSASSRAGPAPH